jgi:hypothetical protein
MHTTLLAGLTAEQLGVFEWNHVETASVAREKPRLIR